MNLALLLEYYWCILGWSWSSTTLSRWSTCQSPVPGSLLIWSSLKNYLAFPLIDKSRIWYVIFILSGWLSSSSKSANMIFLPKSLWCTGGWYTWKYRLVRSLIKMAFCSWKDTAIMSFLRANNQGLRFLPFTLVVTVFNGWNSADSNLPSTYFKSTIIMVFTGKFW